MNPGVMHAASRTTAASGPTRTIALTPNLLSHHSP